jgi:hypothetical protein
MEERIALQKLTSMVVRHLKITEIASCGHSDTLVVFLVYILKAIGQVGNTDRGDGFDHTLASLN